MNENTPVYDWDDAINFIAERCDIDKETIEKILILVAKNVNNVKELKS